MNFDDFDKIAISRFLITNYTNYTSLDEYQNAKSEYDLIQTQILDGQILRSKCQFYESGEKPTKFFLNLEKKRAKTTTLQRLCIDPENSIETTQNEKILQEIKTFYTNIYAKATDKSVEECELFLCNFNMSTLSIEQINFLNIPITVQDLLESIKKSDNGKSPGSDGLTREFYIVFWNMPISSRVI